MAFSLRQLSYFIAVADQGTVSGAARLCSISQSAVTEAIKFLEQDLNVSLFERHSRGLRLTVKGRKFQRHAMKILNDIAIARQSFTEDKQEYTGPLRIGVTHLISGYLLSELLSRFRMNVPQVKLKVIEDSKAYLEHLVIGCDLDFALMVVPKQVAGEGLRMEVLDVSTYQVWLPLGHSLLNLDIIPIEAVSQYPIIILDLDHVSDGVEEALSSTGIKPNILLKTQSVEAVRSLVASGAGITVLPDFIYRAWSLEAARIERRELSGHALPALQICMVWRGGTILNSVIKDFLRIAKDINF